MDPEFAELFQLETIGGRLLLGEALGEMSEVQTDRVISLARELANSAGGELFTSAAGRELLINCDDYSNEMLSALRPLVKDD
ncbi:hypothetical protein ACFZDJ_40435 [Streptomyces sp. NPDC007896]|uniref:hypothetical protein n=1 Tax=Streptomyces sp. NPDC007896 TaxID=3364784 RepID=UPI0036E22E67